MREKATSLFLVAGLLSAFAVSCGNSNNSNSAGSTGAAGQAVVSVTLSDPVVCSAPQGGPFQHIYVTITDIQLFPSTSSPLQNGVDLTPGLSQKPLQIDLLGQASSNCILATLGTAASVPAGTYQAMQVSIAGGDQVSKIQGGSKCPNTSYGPAANCAVLANGSAVYLDPVTTGSFAYDGSVLGGKLDLNRGTQVVNVDFDSCASMFFLYGSEYGMDPVLHAALMPSTGTITGEVRDANTQQPISGDLIVALEQVDPQGVDREIMQTSPAPDGSFVLCPVPPGSYDVVAVALSDAGTPYAATITTQVQAGNSLGTIPLQALNSNQSLATLTGQVTATGPVPPFGGYTHVVVSALQAVSLSGQVLLVTIPLPTQYASTLRAVVTDTATYEMYVPAANPLVGNFSASSATKYQQVGGASVTYVVGAQSSCNPSTMQTTAITVSSGSTSTVPTIAFQGCPAA